MNLIDFYKSILNDAGLVVDQQGFVSVNNSLFSKTENNEPVFVEGKRLVLPTHEQLSNGATDTIKFHPLTENLMRGESPIITKLKNLFNVRLSFTIAAVSSSLLELCASINKHKNLSPSQIELLSLIPVADETMLRTFSQLLLKTIKDDSVPFIKLYLKRAGSVSGKKYSRVCVVSFPFYEELLKDQETYLGVKLRKKDREAFIKVFQYLLKNIDQPETYNRGSDSDIAPFLDSLMKSVIAIASNINDVVHLYSDVLPDIASLEFNAEYFEDFQNLKNLSSEIRKIPVQAGNEGEARKETAVATPVAPTGPVFTPTPVVQPTIQQQVTAQPFVNTQINKSVEVEKGKVPFSSLVKVPQNNIPMVGSGQFNNNMIQQVVMQAVQQLAPQMNGMYNSMSLPPSLQTRQQQQQQQFYMNTPQVYNHVQMPGMPRSQSSVPGIHNLAGMNTYRSF